MSGWQLENPVRQLALNSGGRDFAVGDLHGCLPTLQRALDRLQFNPSADRLFSVGDLIDRGPCSAGCTELLDEPWFFACLGNHESVLLDFIYSQDTALAKRWQRFGGEWFFELGFKQQTEIAQRLLRHCSYAIELSSNSAVDAVAVGIVHADVPPNESWQSFTAQVPDNSDMQYCAMWSRERGNGERRDCIQGVEQIITGHQIVSQAHQAGNVWLLDTGAYRGESSPCANNSGNSTDKFEHGALTVLELSAMQGQPNRLHRF